MAMLDAILCPEWEFRFYSFNARWSTGEQMGSMRNGQGDQFFAMFNSAGCFLKGFAHEAPMTPYRSRPRKVWPGVFDEVPSEFADCLTELAFSIEDTTFCIWRRYGDVSWQQGKIEYPPGPDPDGSQYLLSPLDGKPETYQVWAEDYYAHPVRLQAVRLVYQHGPLTEALVVELNPEVSPGELVGDSEEIGYPAGGGSA
jgi:hypothetical protein